MSKSESMRLAKKIAKAVEKCFDSPSFSSEFVRQFHNDPDLHPFNFIIISLYMADPEALKFWIRDILVTD
jgi:hypothetical protein